MKKVIITALITLGICGWILWGVQTTRVNGIARSYNDNIAIAQLTMQAILDEQSVDFLNKQLTQLAEPTQTARVISKVIVVTSTLPPAQETPTPITPIPLVNVPFIPRDGATKGPGFYLVPSEIKPGTWKSDGNHDFCYWQVAKADGTIMQNYFGMAGGSMYVPPNAYEVQLAEECGNWTFVK